MSKQAVAEPQSATPEIAETPVLEEDTRDLWAKMQEWFMNDSPSWLASLLLHMAVLLVVGLFFGHKIVREITGDPYSFETPQAKAEGEEEIERFEIGDAPLDPTELTTESLMLKDAGEQAQQEAMYFDDSNKFEEQGGGTQTGSETGAGGLGFNIKAEGLGPVLKGGGGAEMGKGEGTDFGKGGGGSGFGGRGQGHREAMLGRYGGTRATERAVAGGLNWIVRHQNPDGSWSIGKYTSRCKDKTCTGGGSVDADAGATALGLLPFLAAGQTHQSKGPYQKQIGRAVQWLLKNQKSNGDLAGNAHQPMYSHGLAAIALCETAGMTGDSQVRHAAQAAIKFIETGQNQEGGWRYTHGTTESDTSVFGWLMMAVKSAQMAGIPIDKEKYDKAMKWLATMSEAPGQYRYRAGAPASPPMSALALLILQYAGADRKDPTIVAGVKHLMSNMPNINERDTYYWYYATQTMHNMVDADWDTWNKKMRRILVETQNRDIKQCAIGSWDPDKPTSDRWGMTGGRMMVTSLSVLTLEVYYRYLPLYKLDDPKGGKGEKAETKKPAAETKKE